MGTGKLKSTARRVANALIICVVIVGTVVFALINQASSGGEVMTKLFLLFFGAIITIQVIPGLILLATMVKGTLSLGQKKLEPAKTAAHDDDADKHLPS